MMGRDTIERIVSSLPTGDLIKALGSVGVRLDSQAGGGYSPAPVPMAAIEEQMSPWNQTLVQAPLTKRPPIVNLAPLIEPAQPQGMLGPDPISATASADVTPWAAAVAG